MAGKQTSGGRGSQSKEVVEAIQKAGVEQGMDNPVRLFRPVGAAEMDLIVRNGRFPPRLPGQPIFYPVCNEKYATEITLRWNTGKGEVAYVTAFWVDQEFLKKYETHVVGASYHEEYWIPAEDLEAFNDAIIGPIERVGVYVRNDRK